MEEKKSFKETVKEKCSNLMAGIKNAGNKVVEYVNSHDEMVRPICMGVAAVIGGIICGAANVNVASKSSAVVEDDITGLEFRTKHPLTNSEILELDSRMIDGSSMGESLSDMGLLKKERKRR